MEEILAPASLINVLHRLFSIAICRELAIWLPLKTIPYRATSIPQSRLSSIVLRSVVALDARFAIETRGLKPVVIFDMPRNLL
jgi:hypothetical protein